MNRLCRVGGHYSPAWLSLCGLLLCAALMPTAEANQTVAVSYFDNNSGDDSLNPLAKGIADMLITDLGKVKSIKVVERSRLNDLLKEIDLGTSEFIDPSTAATLGRGLGATHILTGAFAVNGAAMRIDARLVSVESSAIEWSDSVEGTKTDFFAMEKYLAEQMVSTLGISLDFKEKLAVQQVSTSSFEAFAAYSDALDALDRDELERASSSLSAALAADSNFAAAKTTLEEAKARFSETISERETLFASHIDRVEAYVNALPSKDEFTPGQQQEMLALIQPYTQLSDTQKGERCTEMYRLSSAFLDLKLPESMRFNGVSQAGSLAPNDTVTEWMIYHYIVAANNQLYAWRVCQPEGDETQIQKLRADVVTWSEEYIITLQNSKSGLHMGLSPSLRRWRPKQER